MTSSSTPSHKEWYRGQTGPRDPTSRRSLWFPSLVLKIRRRHRPRDDPKSTSCFIQTYYSHSRHFLFDTSRHVYNREDREGRDRKGIVTPTFGKQTPVPVYSINLYRPQVSRRGPQRLELEPDRRDPGEDCVSEPPSLRSGSLFRRLSPTSF